MKFFANSDICNSLVSVSLKAYALEKKLYKNVETENIIELYNVIQKAEEMIEDKVIQINQKRRETEDEHNF